jgi:hypothetical protein
MRQLPGIKPSIITFFFQSWTNRAYQNHVPGDARLARGCECRETKIVLVIETPFRLLNFYAMPVMVSCSRSESVYFTS